MAMMSGITGGSATPTPDATAATKGKLALTGQLGGTADSPAVTGLTESGSAALAMGAMADGQFFRRSGSSVLGQDIYEDLVFTLNGGASEIADAVVISRQVNFPCTIVAWTLLANVSGSIVLDIWKDSLANYPPTVADTITASAKPTISSGTNATSSTLTGWTTSISAGDVLTVHVDSCTTITTCVVILKVRR